MGGVRRVAIVGVRHGVVVADADVVFRDCYCCDCSCMGISVLLDSSAGVPSWCSVQQ